MSTYSVLISQKLERLGRITVEADSEDEAMSIVEGMVEDGDFESDVDWGESNYEGEPEVLSADAEESEEEE